MSLKDMTTVVLSVAASACVSLWLGYHWRLPVGDYLQVKGIEMIDDHHRVRARIGMAQVGALEVPELALLDERGRPSVLLDLNPRGEGTLFFSSANTEGKVGVGYLSGSDVATSETGEVTDERNVLGAWGVRVLGPDLQTISLGFGNAGQRFAPAH